MEVCEAVGEGRSVSLVEGEGRGSSIVVASLGKVTGSCTGVAGGGGMTATPHYGADLIGRLGPEIQE